MIFKRFLIYLGRLWSYIPPLHLQQNIYAAYTYLYTGYYSRYMKHFGSMSRIVPTLNNWEVNISASETIAQSEKVVFSPHEIPIITNILRPLSQRVTTVRLETILILLPSTKSSLATTY